MIERYEIVRDDGNMAIGLGYSYSYYQLDTETGDITMWDREFAHQYEITPSQSTDEDIKAITEGFTGGVRNIMYAKRLPVVDVEALLIYLTSQSLMIDEVSYTGVLTIRGISLVFSEFGGAHEVPFRLVIDIDGRSVKPRVHCDDQALTDCILAFFKEG